VKGLGNVKGLDFDRWLYLDSKSVSFSWVARGGWCKSSRSDQQKRLSEFRKAFLGVLG
jgi:hypothetical protein